MEGQKISNTKMEQQLFVDIEGPMMSPTQSEMQSLKMKNEINCKVENTTEKCEKNLDKINIEKGFKGLVNHYKLFFCYISVSHTRIRIKFISEMSSEIKERGCLIARAHQFILSEVQPHQQMQDMSCLTV